MRSRRIVLPNIAERKFAAGRRACAALSANRSRTCSIAMHSWLVRVAPSSKRRKPLAIINGLLREVIFESSFCML